MPWQICTDSMSCGSSPSSRQPRSGSTGPPDPQLQAVVHRHRRVETDGLRRRRARRPVQHEPPRAVGRVLAQQHDRAAEVRIVELGHREQERRGDRRGRCEPRLSCPHHTAAARYNSCLPGSRPTRRRSACSRAVAGGRRATRRRRERGMESDQSAHMLASLLRTLPGDDARQIMWRFADRDDLQTPGPGRSARWRGARWRGWSPAARGARHAWTPEKHALLAEFDRAGVTTACLDRSRRRGQWRARRAWRWRWSRSSWRGSMPARPAAASRSTSRWRRSATAGTDGAAPDLPAPARRALTASRRCAAPSA